MSEISKQIRTLCTGDSRNLDDGFVESVGRSVISDSGMSVWDLIDENRIYEAVMAFKPHCCSPSLALSSVRRIAEHVPNTYLHYVDQQIGMIAQLIHRDDSWGYAGDE